MEHGQTFDRNGQVICEPLVAPRVFDRNGKVICEPLDFDLLDARRARNGISVAAVIRTAELHPKTWLLGQHGGALRSITLAKIKAAIDMLATQAPSRRPPPAILSLICAVEALLLAAVRPHGKPDKKLLGKLMPRRGGVAVKVVMASRIHAIALYLVAVELEIPNAEVARAVGSSRNNVRQVRGVIEDLREDPAVDALFMRLATQLKGSPV